MANKPRRFGEMERPFGGKYEVKEIEEILDKEITVLDCEKRNGQFGDFLAILIESPESKEPFVIQTAGTVLMKRVLQAKEQGWLPLPGKIVREKRYYNII